MIDVHCHLEQKDYNKDRENVISECKKKMKAVITSCAHPNDIKLTLEIAEKHKSFVFASIGLHPEYIKELSAEDTDNVFKAIINNKTRIVAVGEVGLDYHWIKEEEWREKQKKLFRTLIQLASRLKLPLVVHSRDAMSDTLDILEQEGMKGRKVLLHLFNEKSLLERVIQNGWSISIGPAILRSKDLKKIARDCPLQNIMLETDSPWFGFGQRGTPLNVIKAAGAIAEIKKISVEEVEKQTDLNAVSFFKLKIK